MTIPYGGFIELPNRKPTRLKNYDYSNQNYYFVTICTHDKLHLFGDVIKLNQYGEIAKTKILNISNHFEGVRIDKYVIMPNHIHMIIIINGRKNGTMWASSPTPESLPQRIKSFKTLVTKEIGYAIWQRSYHDHIIRNANEYQNIWQYIDENPLKWQEDCFYGANTN